MTFADTLQQKGPSVLVVEDVLLVAEIIAFELSDAGYHVVGPLGKLQQALCIATVEALDGAFLDVNLAGEFSFPIADVLLERGIPFIFLTGYADSMIPAKYQVVPRLTKPFSGNALLDAAHKFVKTAASR